MDFEFRELLRQYRADPTWSNGYRLLRLNQRITGELISRDTLELFTKVHLLEPFMRAIEKLHDHEYQNIIILEGEEWDIWQEGLQYNARLQDDERSFQQGFIPHISDHPFKFMVVIILRNDIQYGNMAGANFFSGLYSGARPFSITFGRRLEQGLSNTLSSNTIYELRQYIRRNFNNYDINYVWGNPWGYQDVLMLPRDEWDAVSKRNNSHLMIIYTFYPDDVLWHLLMGMEFNK